VTDPFDSSATVLRRALSLGAIVALVIAVGSAFALLFLGVTALSLLIAGRFQGLGTNAFFAALLAGWLVKFVVFLVAMLALRDQPWVVPGMLFAAIVTTVLASLVVDAVVVSRARIAIGAR
jgi:hypothetical protein